jgi:hypothetical protein
MSSGVDQVGVPVAVDRLRGHASGPDEAVDRRDHELGAENRLGRPVRVTYVADANLDA